MARNFCLALLLALSAPFAVHAQEQPKGIVLHAARMLDVESGKVVSPGEILVQGERIAEAGMKVSHPAGAEVMDLGDVTLMPGLIDAHVHLFLHPGAEDLQTVEESVPWRTIIDNVLLPIELEGRIEIRHREKAAELLRQVGLERFQDSYPHQLSGGMRQRASITRALIQDPNLLLMDEPFGALDALTREQMISDLQTLWLKRGNSVLFITHGIEEAIFLADRVIVMSPRPGRIVQTLEITLPRPRTWAGLHNDPHFQEYMQIIRTSFEESRLAG